MITYFRKHQKEQESDMKVLKKERKLCVCCMEEHEVLTVRVKERNTFQGLKVEYNAIYEYCEVADQYIASDDMISANVRALKDAYEKSTHK